VHTSELSKCAGDDIKRRRIQVDVRMWCVMWPGSVRADSVAASRLEQTLSEVASSLGSGGLQPRLATQPTWALHTQIWLQLGTSVSVSHAGFLSYIIPRAGGRNKKAQLTQGLRATAPSFQDGRQSPSWILSK